MGIDLDATGEQLGSHETLVVAMSVKRPTFSESWHRVSGLRCRLRPAVDVVRQSYRDRVWHVLQDPTANQFFRLNDAAYGFVGLLDGRRTVEQAWNACCTRMGDAAPTQVEVVELLGNLYTSNLLHGQVPGDAQAVFRRARKRVGREIRGVLMNIMFLRIPLLDPDAFLSRWAPTLAWIFTRTGVAVWMLVVLIGGWHLIGRGEELTSGLGSVLLPENLPWLYAMFVLIKLVHELAHGFCCKVLGRRETLAEDASAGEVRTLGLMLMVFMPVPYVDASSSWKMRSKWSRALVAAAGILAEVFLAGIAAVIWARSGPDTLVSALAYNAIFVAGVSSLVFNGNPLMRYDGYFVLSELIEIPNLAKGSSDYMNSLVKRWVWRVPNLPETDATLGEKAWFVAYAPASLVYRLVVYAGILYYLVDRWFALGIALAAVTSFAWLVVPTGRFVRFLTTSPELARVRLRALATTALFVACVMVLIGVIPVPQHVRVVGVVESGRVEDIHTLTDGWIVLVRPSSDRPVAADERLLLSQSPETLSRRREIAARLQRLEIEQRQARVDDPAKAQQLSAQSAALTAQLQRIDEELSQLTLTAPFSGTWICPGWESMDARYVPRGTHVGTLCDLHDLRIRATATQMEAARLLQAETVGVVVRPMNRPDDEFSAQIERVIPAGQWSAPAVSLANEAGGPLRIDPDTQRTAAPFFELRLRAQAGSGLSPGQRVVARFHLPSRPLLLQAVDWVDRMFTSRLRA